MANSDNWTPWTVEGDLIGVPCMTTANDNVPIELRALGAAIGKGYWPPLPANDNHGPLLIGITGKRNVGKSTVANLLESKYGFARVHAFDGGKEAALAYFKHITGLAPLADRMVYGDLKDVPSPYLPGNVAPRYFLEKFGNFMGVTLGVEWTLAMEIARIRRETPKAPIVVESVVYEAPWFKSQGGFVLRLERPEHEGPAGISSDSVQAAIEADETIEARSVDELERKANLLVQQLIGGR
ncbi:hypothetical protein EXN69_26225 [Rhizobium rhizogenes]|nr:hypothetical protein [Rhizobium rhizogenes]KEA07458.1 hypothetical protein CN09_11105 [Rhizobium rhizogenes]NTJ22276.1 hypothetical protein [Rhizobium rhizogenes]TQO81218.1 hypothetical protein FFE80_07340 [Rhizobium rhizogenes]TRB51755.1 hypothetical protein EXN69_26225 [Rhizobium rhizogenes]